jgi:hypothetical protein
MGRQLAVGSGAKNYTSRAPPIANYRKVLGKKEVHSREHKEFRRAARDRPGHRTTAAATESTISSGVAWVLLAAVLGAFLFAWVSVRGMPTAETLREQMPAELSVASIADDPLQWLWCALPHHHHRCRCTAHCSVLPLLRSSLRWPLTPLRLFRCVSAAWWAVRWVCWRC